MRRGRILRGSTNRYTDGSGRRLDSNNLPRELYLQPMSNRAYPAVSDHWQTVVEAVPTKEKGMALISGAGVVGCTAASLLALRGWSVAVVEEAEHQEENNDERHVMVTRRALDVLEGAGVPLTVIRPMGCRIEGVWEHPSGFNAWWVSSLVEYHPFAVNMLSLPLSELREHLRLHVAQLPSGNARILKGNKIHAVLTNNQVAVVGPIRETVRPRALAIQAERDGIEVDGLAYDLLIVAEGANSHTRDLLDVEGRAFHDGYATRWFSIELDSTADGVDPNGRDVTRRRYGAMSMNVVHRWVFPCPIGSDQTAVALAFPTKTPGRYAVQVYSTMDELTRSDDAIMKKYCPDIAARIQIVHSTPATPSPTIYCEELFNGAGYPSAVCIGDSAHHCNPFLMQNFALGLEDAAHLVSHVDTVQRHYYDALRLFSSERGVAGDRLRMITERSLHFARRKHINPLLRLQNAYGRWMHQLMPRKYNELYSGSANYVYPRSLEVMLNGRGYSSYEAAEASQAKLQRSIYPGRVYT